MYDVIIVGGGAMGSAAAWALAGGGRRVLLLERFEPGHHHGGSHGASRIFRLLYREEDYVRLGQRAADLWRRLEDESGESLLTTTGTVEHGLAAAELAESAAFLRRNDVPVDLLDPGEAAERWPGMRFETGVLYQPGGGRLRAEAAVGVLQRLAAAGGVEIRHSCRPTRISPPDGGRDGALVHTDAEAFEARQVIVAAGAWTPRLVADLAALPPLRVTQEQPVHFRPLLDTSAWPGFVHWRHGIRPLQDAESYGLHDPGIGVKVGLHGTGRVVDPDRRDRRPRAAVGRALRDYVARWLPGLGGPVEEPTTCLYDNTASGDFVIDRIGPAVTVATGFSGHGFKFVPAVGELLAALALGEAEPPTRFTVRAHQDGTQ